MGQGQSRMEEERGEQVLERGNPAGACVFKEQPEKIGLEEVGLSREYKTRGWTPAVASDSVLRGRTYRNITSL